MIAPTSPNPTKPCGRCDQLLPLADFAWRRKTHHQLDNYCRACRAAYKREHYAAHKQRYVAKALQRKQTVVAERAAHLLELFREHPCAECGETDPLVLEFDHREAKSFDIAKGVRDRKWQAVLDEIAKCDVVCANCHRRRTALRAGFARAVVAQR